jgi:hypothetical protein
MRRKVNSLNPFLLAAARGPLASQLHVHKAWPVKSSFPSRPLTVGAKEKFLQERVVRLLVREVGLRLQGS